MAMNLDQKKGDPGMPEYDDRGPLERPGPPRPVTKPADSKAPLESSQRPPRAGLPSSQRPPNVAPTSRKLSTTDLKAQTQKSLRGFFQRSWVQKTASVLIPGALAAFLLPAFGAAVAAGAAVVAVQNSLKLLGIDLSAETTEKLLKPFEGKQLGGSDVQAILEDTLKNLLPRDTQVNKEATKVVIVMMAEVKQASVASPDTDLGRLRTALETSLKQQGGMMAEMASNLSALVELSQEQLEVARQRLMVEVNG